MLNKPECKQACGLLFILRCQVFYRHEKFKWNRLPFSELNVTFVVWKASLQLKNAVGQEAEKCLKSLQIDQEFKQMLLFSRY